MSTTREKYAPRTQGPATDEDLCAVCGHGVHEQGCGRSWCRCYRYVPASTDRVAREGVDLDAPAPSAPHGPTAFPVRERWRSAIEYVEEQRRESRKVRLEELHVTAGVLHTGIALIACAVCEDGLYVAFGVPVKPGTASAMARAGGWRWAKGIGWRCPVCLEQEVSA